MSRAKRPYVAHPRNPLTHRQFRVSATTPRELQSYLAHIDGLGQALRLGLITPEEVDRKLRRLQHGAVTLERAALAYAEREDLAENTRRNARSFVAVHPQLCALELEQLEAPVLQKWMERLHAQKEPDTIRTTWRTLRAIVRYAASRGWIGRSPWGPWRPVIRGGSARTRREAARDPRELALMIDTARLYDDRERERARFGDCEPKIASAGLAGLRQGELAGLRWPDIDERRCEIDISRQYEGRPVKQLKAARISVDHQLIVILRAHRARLEAVGLYAPRGPVFPDMRTSTPGRPRAKTSGEVLSRYRLRTIAKAAGVPDPDRWVPHSLRDSFMTLEETGHPELDELQDRGRYASKASVVRYLHARRGPIKPGFTLPALPSADRPPEPQS